MKTTLSIYECGEFHDLGKSFTGIKSVEEAVRLWESIPACNLNGIKALTSVQKMITERKLRTLR